MTTNYNTDPHNGAFTYTLQIHIPKPYELLSSPKTFGDHLPLAGMKRGWQILELARMVGADEMSVKDWERRGARPAYPYIRLLKKVLPELAELAPDLVYEDDPTDPTFRRAVNVIEP